MNSLTKTILIAPNSFKESADSVQVCNWISEFLTDAGNYKKILFPISDGGDGFREVCKYHFGGEELTYYIPAAYSGAAINCPFLYSKNDKTIFIEAADVLGLKVVPKSKRKPLQLSSIGLGTLLSKINDDVKNGTFDVKNVIIGIGGTATTDLGIGACSAFGLKLFDKSGNQLEVVPANFKEVDYFEWKNQNLHFSIKCIVDVENPLIGSLGAINIFAKQKGASERELDILEDGFINLSKLFEKNNLTDSSKQLSGAGGGIAAGLNLFLNAEVCRAENFIVDTLNLIKYKNQIDFIITGEGALDEQTLMGKGAGLLIDYFSSGVKKFFFICGFADDSLKDRWNEKITIFQLSRYFNSLKDSIKNIQQGVQLACDEIKRYL